MKKRLYLLLAICCLSLLSFTACTTNDGIRRNTTTETSGTVARPTTGATTGTTTGTTIAPTTTTTPTTPTTR